MSHRQQTVLLIFDLDVVGHHPGYLRYLLCHWPAGDIQLIFVVSPEFAKRHPDVVHMPTAAQVAWQPVTQQELQWYEKSKRSLVRHSWAEWRLYCRYAKKVKADQGLIMYIDRFQLPMALRFFLPCKTSGIFFRPKFHYGQFAGSRPRRSEQVRRLREQWLWRSALRHPQLKTLFCLDPLAVVPLRALGGSSTVVHLPDPVEVSSQPTTVVTALQQELGIAPERKVLLLFGMIDRRKGIYQVLEALQQLSPAQQAQLTLLLVGQVAKTDCANIIAIITRIQRDTPLQIVLHNCFVPEDKVPVYFALADVVLALYQHHVGSSGILLWAAATGKPVLASDYGLMGEVVRQHRLGVTVDSTDTSAIATELSHFLEQSTVPSFLPTAATQFASENSTGAFVRLLCAKIGK